MRDFHAEAVRIWPLNDTSRQRGCHAWDRALEVAYQPPAAQCGRNYVPVGHIYPKRRSGASFGHAATRFPNARFPAQSVARALVLLRARGQMEREWEQNLGTSPKGRSDGGPEMHRGGRFAAELAL